MKLSACMIVLNGMPYMPYLLRGIYPVMDEIIIVEGAVETTAELADKNGHSTDGTVEAIRHFSDPERKIKLIQIDGYWPEKNEMCFAFAEACTGDYLWQMDADEFYKPRDMLWLKDYLAQNREVGAVSFTFLNFFGGMQSITNGAWFYYNRSQIWRLLRWGKGYRYVTYRQPTALDESGVDTKDYPVLHGNMLSRKYGIYTYHYSYVTRAQVAEKMHYHQRYKKGGFLYIDDYDEWYQNHFQTFTPWRVHPDERPMSWLEPFRGQHPEVIQQLIADHPEAVASRPEIARLLDSPLRWRFWKLVGTIDAVCWWLYDRPFRRMVRPFVRPIRARFFGYDYNAQN